MIRRGRWLPEKSVLTWAALLAQRKGGGRSQTSSQLVCLRKASSEMTATIAAILLPRSTVEDTQKGSLQVCCVPTQEKLLSELCEVTVVSSKLKWSPESRMPREGSRMQTVDCN